MLSPHNPSTIYLGGERLFKSIDRGNTWMMSPDLTKNIGRNDRPIMGVDGKAPMASKHDGAASYSNIVTISESPVVPGIVWVGTNDGNVQVSRDGGVTWKNVVDKVPGVPKETHVSRVEASPFDAGTCYVTFDGHRTDDIKPYVFVTNDFGETWTSIAANLPDGNVNVITEDPRNQNLLFLGTEYAIYVSLDAGKAWKRFMTGLPTVRIDDIIIHPRERDLIAGTHGRSIWILDDISPLEQMGDDEMKGGCVSVRRPAGHRVDQRHPEADHGGRREVLPRAESRSGNGDQLLARKPASSVKISISDVTGREVRSIDGSKDAGINRVQWDLRANPPARGTPPARRRTRRAAAQANPPAAGRQGQGREDQPPATPPARGGQAAQGQPAPAPEPAAPQPGGRGGRGRGNVAPQLPAGSYLLKLSVDGKTIGTKTVVIEGDSLQ